MREFAWRVGESWVLIDDPELNEFGRTRTSAASAFLGQSYVDAASERNLPVLIPGLVQYLKNVELRPPITVLEA